MRKNILDRYIRSADDELIIDITAGKVEDLYNDFDKHTAYVKKDLDQDLAEYLIDSASEIGKEDFIIQFRLDTVADESLTSRVKTSIYNYFQYLSDLELREFSRMKQTSFILFIIGVVILFLSVWINQNITEGDTVITHVFAEGLNVAAWVSLWNAIATFLINWAPHRRTIKLYSRISTATILFNKPE